MNTTLVLTIIRVEESPQRNEKGKRPDCTRTMGSGAEERNLEKELSEVMEHWTIKIPLGLSGGKDY